MSTEAWKTRSTPRLGRRCAAPPSARAAGRGSRSWPCRAAAATGRSRRCGCLAGRRARSRRRCRAARTACGARTRACRAGLPREDRRDEVPVAAVVVEGGPGGCAIGRSRTKPTQSRLRAISSIVSGGADVSGSFQSRPDVDVEQVSDRQLRLACRSALATVAPEERLEHRLVDAGDLAALHGDAGERADDRLGHRVDEVAHAGAKRRVVRLGDDPAVADDEQAVHLVRGAEVDELGERRRRRRPCASGVDDLPAGGRPGRRRRRRRRAPRRRRRAGAPRTLRRSSRRRRTAQAVAIHRRRRGTGYAPALRAPSWRSRPTTPLGK